MTVWEAGGGAGSEQERCTMKVSQESMTRVASGAVSGIDRLISNIPAQTQVTIKGVFFLLMFVLVIGGVVYGVTSGKEAARIKSAPIIENTNEAFDLDIKRENREGNFTALLDSEVINEMKKIDMDKVRFPSQTNLEPDTEKGIIEPDTHRKIKESPEVRVQDPLFEGDYGKKPGMESDVRPIEKRSGSAARDRESMVDSEKRDLPRLREREPDVVPAEEGARDSVIGPPERMRPRPAGDEADSLLESPGDLSPSRDRETSRTPAQRKSGKDVRLLEKKRRSGGTDIRSPKPLSHEEGIIGD